MSYGPDIVDIFRRAAGYIDQILQVPIRPRRHRATDQIRSRGEFESTAKALGLTVPPTLLALADDVIE